MQPMSTDLTTTNGAAIMERVIIAGDLSKLAPIERVSYYRATCESLGLNPLTKPFEYIELDGKLTLYATRTCTDQLREQKRVSVRVVRRELNSEAGVYTVEVEATTPDGRVDFASGVVPIAKEAGEWKTAQSGKRYFAGSGEYTTMRGVDLANALMKAETKAKRRATLSICGLGWMDETELETTPARKVAVNEATGEIVENGSERKRLIGELRALVTEARSLGLEPPLGKPADMTDADLAAAAAAIRQMVDAERQALAEAVPAEAL